MKTSPAEVAFLTVVIVVSSLVFSGFDPAMLAVSIGLFLFYIAIFFSGSIQDHLRRQERRRAEEEE